MPSKDLKLPPSLKQVEVPKKECNKRTVEFYQRKTVFRPLASRQEPWAEKFSN